MPGSLLKKKWEELPAEFQTLQQMYGRNEEGCGATVGAMPRCDFACRGCYLGEEANHIPAASLEEIKGQMRLLRTYLGKWVNLQLTDGEITLRDPEEILSILHYAKEIELVPIIMTHGDHFRKNPEFLYRLVQEGGLREVSIHIDTTQRGRFGGQYKYATSESELMPLREEFAELIRSVKKVTGVRLRAASTVTVSEQNLSEVSSIAKWFAANSDAFRIVSFLPVAQVGRTESQVGDLGYQNVWKEVEKGLQGTAPVGKEYSEKSQWWMGHPECSRFVFGFVLKRENGELSYRRMSMAEDQADRDLLEEYYSKWSGISMRGGSQLDKLLQVLKMIVSRPSFFFKTLPEYLFRLLGEYQPGARLSLVRDLLLRRSRLGRFTVITHHFMDSSELATPLGQERLKYCSFMVPFRDELVSMCEFNALGKRSEYYSDLANQKLKVVGEGA